MSRTVFRRVAITATGVLIAAAGAGPLTASPSARAPLGSAHGSGRTYRHVLLLSIDGMHQSDLRWYLAHHPRSALATLVRRGTEFTRARTPFPSDSFPGMVGQVTGGNPKTTGIYYDVTYNHRLLDPAASTSAVPTRADCAAATPGANVSFDESVDKNADRLDAGQGLTIPRDILEMTTNPRTLIDPAKLPIDPKTCKRVYPHQYLKVNTVFEVARAHHLRTAWADKHPAYEILNGPSGRGVQDLFTPEINSIANRQGGDWTTVNSLTQRYDQFKVRAVLNEIAGYDHSGTTRVGMPAIFGMNFQSVSTAQKLPTSGGQLGGYVDHGKTPGPVLRSALNRVNSDLAALISALKDNGHYDDTAVVLSSKHGQSPMEREALTRIDDSTILAQLNHAWATSHPTAEQPLVAASLDDDGMLLWFTNGDRNKTADAFASRFLRGYDGSGTGTDNKAGSTDINGNPKPYTRAGLRSIRSGVAAARFLDAAPHSPRIPDLIGLVQHGVVYTDKTGKISEHGGDDPQDRHVPLVVSAPGLHHTVRRAPVETTQVAPTILTLLGLSPHALRAVRIEHTTALNVN